MKNTIILTVLIAAITFGGCNKSNSGSSAEANFDKDASYAIGMNIGSSLKESLDADGIIPDYDEFMKGFRDGITGGNMRFDSFEAMTLIETAFNALSERKNADAMEQENAFLAENARKPGIRITSSGLQYEVITETTGRKPSDTDTVLVHYEGKLTDGTVFDNSHDRGSPMDFPVNAVIPGWTEGLQLMGIGSKYILYIPSNLGYGPTGVGPIPPFATLIFTVELIDIL